MPTEQQQINKLKEAIKGSVVVPGDSQYDTLRSVWAKTGNPACIIRCQNADDVAAAIRFASDTALTVSVRSGGHSGIGASTNDGGMVIDLTSINTVEILDTDKRLVRIGAGAHWGDVAKTLGTHGLAISSGDTRSVGVGGLTLGGGVGWLVRTHGLAIDSLEAADIVTADGRKLHLSTTEHPDLFWAIRGGGGNFGVVTSFTFRAQPCATIVGGQIVYDAADTKQLLTKWAEYMRKAPEKLNSTVIAFPGFGPADNPQLMVLVCYADANEAEAQKAIQPLTQLGTIIKQDIQAKPYSDMLEEARQMPEFKAQVRNGFAETLDEAAITAIADHFAKPGSPVLQIRSLGGALNRVRPEATAFAHRHHEALLIMASIAPATVSDEQLHTLADTAWQPLKPFVHGAYTNFLTDVRPASIAAAYPADTYARLSRIKAAYDPNNIFDQNINIRPAPLPRADVRLLS